MTMRRFISFCSYILLCFLFLPTVSAQPGESFEAMLSRGIGFRFVPRLDELSCSWWSGAELHAVDTTCLEVVYNLKYRKQRGEGSYHEMLVVLQVGVTRQKYYSMIRQFTDDIQRDVAGQSKDLAAAPGVGYQHQYTDEELRIKAAAGKDWLNSEIWTDIPTRTVTERTHDYKKKDLSVEYDEELPVFEWNLSEQADTIGGLVCTPATTQFRGRKWMVWFTPEIPVGAGPWKFNGLPGLILKAQDSEQDFVWECRHIEQKAVPIVYYKVERQVLTRPRWRRYMRQIHEAPLTMLGEGGNYGFVHGDRRIGEDDNWTIPYNPIELE